MKFQHTLLTLSGLRQMWRKKEYGCMYKGLRRVKKHRRLAARNKMMEGVAKMELDEKEGRGYASGRRLKDEGDKEGEQPRKKMRRNNTLTSTQHLQA